MADYTTIDDPSAHFQTIMWVGNGSADQTKTWGGNSDLQADLLWGKCSSEDTPHYLNDTSRGITVNMHPNTTNIDVTDSNVFTSVSTNSFVVGSDADINGSSRENIVWGWKANGGSTSSNTDGDLTTTVQVNSTAKLSIFTYTGIDPIEPLDLGHGLGVAPDFFIIKTRSIAGKYWAIYHKDMAATPQNNYLRINSTNAVADASTWWRDEAPTSTIIKTGEQDDINRAASTFVCYAWKEVQGFSKFGGYTGNGHDDGPFIYLGFTPSLVIIKRTDSAGNWIMHSFDQGTNSSTGVGHGNNWNLNNNALEINDGDSQNQYGDIDMVSNGFKIRKETNAFGATDENDSGGTYIYMAWAFAPVVTSTDTNSIPATAQ